MKKKGKRKTDDITYLPHTELRVHPRNMRRAYPHAKVEQMAASIRSRGVLQPLVGVQMDGYVQIVIGNLRLAAAYHLGEDAPPMPVIIKEREEADQLLDMAAENIVRVKPDLVSEALHYRRILEEPGMTKTRLARETGIALATINARLRLLELEPEIQELMAAGRLTYGIAVIEALLSIPDSTARVGAAQRLAEKRANVYTIRAACTKIRRSLKRRMAIEEAARQDRDYAPAIIETIEDDLLLDEDQVVPWKQIEEGMGWSCSTCDVLDSQVLDVDEPAWLICRERGLFENVPDPTWGEVSQGATATCIDCGLRDAERICGTCPLIEFMSRVARLVGKRDGED